jgi:glycine oxidase
VMVIERAGLGSEASAAAAGMLAPQAEADRADDFFSLACRSRDLYPSFAEALREETGTDIELDTTGTLYLAFTEHDVEEVERRYDWQTRAGLPVQRLSAADVHLLEPSIAPNIHAGLRFPLDIQVENRRLVRALAESNKNHGVQIITGTTVESIRIERSRVEGLETSRGFVSTPNVVLAGGAWTSFIKARDKALPDLRIEPVRGQMICFEANPRVARHVIYSSRGYIVPRMDGRVLGGSTTEPVGFDKRVTAAGMHSILSHALEICSGVAALPVIDSWAGLRPRAPDSLPVLGAYAEIAGLFYATGHYRNGILLAPITGELIAEAIAETSASPLLGAFAPERFEIMAVN